MYYILYVYFWPTLYFSVRSMYTAYTVGTIIKNVLVFIFNPDDIFPNYEF
jgi:hypothetical protein